MIFMEAAACRKPSVAYAKGSIPEVILNGKTGLLARNYEEMKKSALLLIKDKKLRKALGENALKFSKNFRWEKIAREYEKVFKAIAKK